MAFRARLQGAVDRARALAVRASLRVSPTEPQRVLLLTIALGAVCGLVAVAFHVAIRTAQTLLIDRFQNVSLDATSALAVLLLPAAGGVVAGVLLEHVVPSARGSGIPQVKLAYALDSRGTRLRDAVGKFFVCTLQLGSGASLGREGPRCRSVPVSPRLSGASSRSRPRTCAGSSRSARRRESPPRSTRPSRP